MCAYPGHDVAVAVEAPQELPIPPGYVEMADMTGNKKQVQHKMGARRDADPRIKAGSLRRKHGTYILPSCCETEGCSSGITHHM